MSKIIAMLENEDRELNMSLYDFIDEQYRRANPIMVCHVTEEEYNNMKKQIKSGYLHERLPRIAAKGDIGYNKFRYVVTYDKHSNDLLISDYDNPDKIGSYRIDNEGIHYDEKGYQITNHPIPSGFISSWHNLKVYTTESYKNIIAHYEARYTREELIKEKTRELIELIGKSCHTCNSMCCGGLADASECSKWSHLIS